MGTVDEIKQKILDFEYQKWFFKKDKIGDVWVPALAEFVASGFFVFIACGSAMNTVNFSYFAGSVHVQVALAFGFMITALAFAIGHISGGHINFAVTFAFVSSGRISPLRGAAYFLGQFFGGIVGALMLKALMPQAFFSSCFASNYIHPESSLAMGFFFEMFLTFFLLFVVSAATDSQKANTTLTPLAIGFCIYCAHMVGIPITGTSINPTRSFATAVAASGIKGCEGVWENHWVFWFAPILGGVFATYVYQFAFASHWGENLRDQYIQEENAGEYYEDQQQYQDGQAQAYDDQQQQYYDDQQQQYYDDQQQQYSEQYPDQLQQVEAHDFTEHPESR